MTEQQDMRAYVRQRMAGTEAAPVPPDANPMASYVTAQAHPRSGGMRVPPQTMMDSPQYLVEPDVERGPVMRSNRQYEQDTDADRRDALQKQVGETYARMNQVGRDTPEGRLLYDRWLTLLGQVHVEDEHFQKTVADPLARQMGAGRAPLVDQTVGDIQGAADERAAQPRQPLPPLAPGGVPLDAPRVPFVPSGVPMS